MGAIFFALYWVLQILKLLLIAAFIVQWVLVVVPGYRPRGIWLYLFEIVLTITDVPLKPLRKVFKPIRIGVFAFDTAFAVLFLAIILLQSWLPYYF